MGERERIQRERRRSEEEREREGERERGGRVRVRERQGGVESEISLYNTPSPHLQVWWVSEITAHT